MLVEKNEQMGEYVRPVFSHHVQIDAVIFSDLY